MDTLVMKSIYVLKVVQRRILDVQSGKDLLDGGKTLAIRVPMGLRVWGNSVLAENAMAV